MTYIPSINISLLIESIPYILKGLPYTLVISLSAFVIGNIIGLFIAVLQIKELFITKHFLKLYVSFLRGTPAIVLLFLLYFGMPIQLPPVTAAIICFSMTSSAFLSEIYRGAIKGIDSGQWEASKALGWSFAGTMIHIILPQSLRIAIPSLSNVAMDIIKGSSLAAMITVPDIFQRAKIVGGREFDFMTMYVLVAMIYWMICILIEKLQHYLERKVAF